MKINYVHQKLGAELHAISGEYTPLKEVILPYKDKEILYVLSSGTADCGSCAGGGFLKCAVVQGYLVAWKNKINTNGLPVSEVTTIIDDAVKQDIIKIIKDRERIFNINFL